MVVIWRSAELHSLRVPSTWSPEMGLGRGCAISGSDPLYDGSRAPRPMSRQGTPVVGCEGHTGPSYGWLRSPGVGGSSRRLTGGCCVVELQTRGRPPNATDLVGDHRLGRQGSGPLVRTSGNMVKTGRFLHSRPVSECYGWEISFPIPLLLRNQFSQHAVHSTVESL